MSGPITQMLTDRWTTLLALALQKSGGELTITRDDIKQYMASDPLTVVVQEDEDGMHLRLVTEDVARAIKLAYDAKGIS